MKKSFYMVFCLLPLLAACNFIGQKEKFEVQPIKVKTLIISEQTHTYAHTYVGKIEEISSVRLGTQSAGQVLSVLVKVGDHVRAGQELLRIDDTQARHALQAANAALEQAHDAYKRAQQMYAEGGVTAQKMVELGSQLEQAQSKVSMSRKSLNDCVLRAPTDGIIGECKVKAGETITPAVSVVTLLNMDGYNVVFDVAEADIAVIRIGESGSVQVAAIGNDTLPIRVVEKSLLANNISHTYTVKAVVLGTHRKEILPGMVSKVWLQSQSVSGYLVPSECVQTLPSGRSIWVVQDTLAQRRSIEIGEYVSNGVIVTNGLQMGDKVICEGFQKMYNGAKVVD